MISCLYEREKVVIASEGGEIGIGVGLTHFATTSEGKKSLIRVICKNQCVV